MGLHSLLSLSRVVCQVSIFITDQGSLRHGVSGTVWSSSRRHLTLYSCQEFEVCLGEGTKVSSNRGKVPLREVSPR